MSERMCIFAQTKTNSLNKKQLPLFRNLYVGSFEVADIYIAKDFSIINDNNFKLIKRVFKKELA